MTGRRSTEQLKALTGSHRPSRKVLQVNGQLPTTPPVGLTSEARAAWTMAIQCAGEGVLSPLDHSVLERWARNYALYRKLAKQVEAEGATSPSEGKCTAAFNALIKVQQQLTACERELGFTPTSRARIAMPDDKSGTEANPFLDGVEPMD